MTLTTPLALWVIPGITLSFLDVLALFGAALWLTALAWLVFGDMIRTARRHDVHLPHHHHVTAKHGRHRPSH